MAFTELSLAPSNLDKDSKAPGRRPYWRRYWPADQPPTMRIDGGGHGLSNEHSFATVAKEQPSQMKICDGYSHGQVARELMSYNHKKIAKTKLLAHLPARGLNLGDHTNQEAHYAPWFGARGLNTGPVLATAGGAPLSQC